MLDWFYFWTSHNMYTILDILDYFTAYELKN